MWMIDNKNKLIIALLTYWVLCNYLVLHAPIQFFAVDGVSPITEVQSIVVDSPVDHPAKLSRTIIPEATSLPDDWYHRGIEEQEVWYLLKLDLEPEKAAIWSVYLPSVTHNAAVFINGVWLGQGGSFEDPVARHHNNPLYFEFSSALLSDVNKIAVRVKASHPRQGLMDQFFLAPASDLRDAYEWKRFLRVDFIRWVTMAMYFMGGIVLCFWLARPQDKIYGLFAMQLFIWATHNLNLFIFEIPTSAHFWEALTMSTLGWTVVAMIFFNHRYIGDGIVWVENLALAFGVCGLGIFFLPNIESILTIGYGVWDSFLVVFGSYAILHLLKVFWRRQDVDVYLMLLVGVPILVFGLHDILTVNNLRDRRDGLTIQYSVIPAIFLFSFFLVRRFVQSINQAEEMSASLEQRVIQKQQALEAQFEQLKMMEQTQVLSQERERIMRDMHDGIGGQLVSVITMLQEYPGEVYKQVREKIQLSLTDLRFVIDSLDPELSDLPTLLGMMRARLSEQLLAANIELQWQVTDLPELPDMSPQRSLHIMRIVQECVSNVIKHSGATKVSLSTSVEQVPEDVIFIVVEDNGLGVESNKKISGRGLKNITFRCNQVGAYFELSQAENGGTRACLKIPY